jgi:hypothetical protein
LQAIFLLGGQLVADDKSQTGPQDASRINMGEEYEIRYWTRKFGCTRAQLEAAVEKVGVSARAVEDELKRR